MKKGLDASPAQGPLAKEDLDCAQIESRVSPPGIEPAPHGCQNRPILTGKTHGQNSCAGKRKLCFVRIFELLIDALATT
jgi:hypothetical protein